MLAAALKFRLEKDVEGIIFKGEDGMKDVPGFLNQFRRGISYIKGNTDKGEFPIYFMCVLLAATVNRPRADLPPWLVFAAHIVTSVVTTPLRSRTRCCKRCVERTLARKLRISHL